ncbi:hypothetical protein [Kluyvera cryocrescens]|uniref:hypothetical protein n=1 Tax=Kluyvera cryocrescens TaxID=580 RepID=UPI0007734601|nr:hypothetical protein [Kluyvera cryocrescens]
MDKSKKSEYIKLAVVLFIAFVVIKACTDSDNSAPPSASSTQAVPVAATTDTTQDKTAADRPPAVDTGYTRKIAEYAFDDYTPDQFPMLNKALGKKGLAEAAKGTHSAAFRVAQSPDCDQVETAAIVNESTKKNVRYFVNCANNNQWHFKASELKDSAGKWYTAENAPAVGMSDTARRAAERENLEKNAPGSMGECVQLLKSRLKHPDSADFHILMGSADFINQDDERTIQVEFEAKNGLGNELTYTGQCVFHKNGKVAVDIFDR